MIKMLKKQVIIKRASAVPSGVMGAHASACASKDAIATGTAQVVLCTGGTSGEGRQVAYVDNGRTSAIAGNLESWWPLDLACVRNGKWNRLYLHAQCLKGPGAWLDDYYVLVPRSTGST